jgi:hypothetical protein
VSQLEPPTARLAAAPGVGIRRDAALPTPPPRPARAPRGLPSAQAADVPSNKTLYADGPSGRFLSDGQWLFRLDARDQGVRQHFERQTLDARLVAGDGAERLERRGRLRGVDARLRRLVPQGLRAARQARALEWAVRFESVNYRSRVYLNGRESAATPAPTSRSSAPEGPAQARRQPARRARRLAPPADRLPALGPELDGNATGGWWNYGGIQREVYLRKLDNRAVQHRARAAQAGPCGRVPGRRSGLHARAGERHRPRPGASARRDRTARAALPARTARLGAPAGPDRGVQPGPACRIAKPRPVVAESARTVPGEITCRLGRAHRSGTYCAQEPACVAHVSRGQPATSTAGRGTSAASACTRTPRTRLRGRRRRSGRARRGGAGARRDRCCARNTRCTLLHELGRQARAADLVGDPRLRGQDDLPQAGDGARARGQGDAPQRRDEPSTTRRCSRGPVGNELSSRPGPGAGRLHPPRERDRKEIDPTPADLDRFAGYPSAGCQSEYCRWTSSGSTSTTAGTRARRQAVRPRRPGALPRQRAPPATRGTRSS